MPKDLSQPTAAEEIYRELQSREIEIDVLVNNAGFNVYGPFWETSAQKELQMMQVHMLTLTHLTKLFLPGMLKRKFGKILNLASTASFTPGPGDAVYCATKAYVLSFSEAVAEELRGTGATVTALCPGPTRTEFAERADMADTKIFQGRLSSAAEVARAGYRALMQEQAIVVVGRTNKLLIFSLRFSPRNLVTRIAKGNIATIGRNKAVADLKFAHLSGLPAWLAWLFVHIIFLVGFRNRLLVLFQWAWAYFTFDKGARLITRNFQSEQRPPA
jgi:hypothetical protein